MDVFGKVAGLFTDKAVGKGVARITLDGDDPPIRDLDQHTAGVGTILGANRAFPHSGSSSLLVTVVNELHYAMQHKEKSSEAISDCDYFKCGYRTVSCHTRSMGHALDQTELAEADKKEQ